MVYLNSDTKSEGATLHIISTLVASPWSSPATTTMASSTAAPELNALAHRLLRKAQDVAETGSADTDPDLRVDIVRALDRMAGTVRDTREPHGMVMWFMAQISCFTAIRLFLKWNAFEKLPIEKEAAISWVELADVLRGDVALISKTSSPFSSLSLTALPHNIGSCC